MKRHQLFACAVALMATACVPNGKPSDDAAAFQQAIKDSYAAYGGFNEQKYRAKLAGDYLLLENGELIDREGARQREWLESAILRRSEGVWQLALLHSTRISTPAGAKDLKSFGTRYTAAWCSQDPAGVAAFFAENGSLKINEGAPSVGRAAITEAARGFMKDFPDMIVEMDGLERDVNGYTYRWTLSGTNTGPGGMDKKVRISGYEEWTIGADGLIAASLGHFDATDNSRQLGRPGG